MPWVNFLLPGVMLCLMWAGLLLARWAAGRQNEQHHKLHQLMQLEARRQRLSEIAQALRQLEVDAEVWRLLQQILRDDLSRIRALDPSRTDIDQQIQQLEAMGPPPASSMEGGPAVATESELSVTHRHIQRALVLFTELYRGKRISAGQCQTARDRLQELGVRVTVNSCLLMAQRAVEQEDSLRALSCFQRADRLLTMKGLPAEEKEQKKRYLHQERERLLNKEMVLETIAGHTL